jgi:hypothetical protein
MGVSQLGNQISVGLTPDQVKTLEQVAANVATQLAPTLRHIQLSPGVFEEIRRFLANLPTLPALPPSWLPQFAPQTTPILLQQPITAYIQRMPLPPPCDHTALESEIARLEGENHKLHAETRTLRSTLLGHVLQADLQQDIDPPGDWADYWFSES